MRYRIALLLLVASSASAEVVIESVPVGNPGNACEVHGERCLGGVGYLYDIGKYEITYTQYAEFLNAIAADDPNGVFGPGGKITRSGSPGSYIYAVDLGFESRPTGQVDFASALRFVNWLHNGQPTGTQDATTTEDGAYTLAVGTDEVTRNAGARFVIPTLDEWHKAAYADGSGGWYDYPAGTDAQTICAAPGAAPNTARCMDWSGGTVDVGSYTASASPSGTFDQGGNIDEWNETQPLPALGSLRALSGGAYRDLPQSLQAGSLAWGDVGGHGGMRISPVTSPLVIHLKQVGGTHVPAHGALAGDTLVLDVGYTIHGGAADVAVALPAIAFDPAVATFQGGTLSGPALWSGGTSAFADSRPEFVVHDAGALHYVSGLGKVASGAAANAPCSFGACISFGTLTFELTGAPGTFETDAVMFPTPYGTRVDGAGGSLLAAARLGSFEVVVLSDGDGDGVADVVDNCDEVPNPSQSDCDSDGFGNACDCEFSPPSSGVCDGASFAKLVSVFGKTTPPEDCQFDMSENGVIDGADFAVWVSYFGSVPGPSCGNPPGTPCPHLP